ncbi:MAG TPA: hypothetical protein VMW55_02810 [Nitrosopumilaceae archaeon]|jgi:hypothetical protein|nr:hypothetical protein [Nitrosopumilaceae archaeon]
MAYTDFNNHIPELDSTQSKDLSDKIWEFPIEKNTRYHSFEKQVCSSCKEEIGSEISRIMIMRDIDRGPRLFCFHFFFPCWDFKLLCQKYPKLTLDIVGFSIPENVLIKERSIKDMQKNIKFWT